MIRTLQKTILTAAFILGCTATQLFAQVDYYWTGASVTSSNWSDITNWNVITNVAGLSVTTVPLTPPQTTDNVFFSNSSFSPTLSADTVTINVNATCANLTWAGVDPNVTVRLVGTGSLIVNGSLSITDTNIDNQFTGVVIFSGSGTTHRLSSTIPFKGAVIVNKPVNASEPSTLTLDSDLTLKGNLTLTAGRLIANGKNITLEGNWLTNGGSFEIDEGDNSIVTFEGSGISTINTNSPFNNLTINKDKDGGSVNLSSHIFLTKNLIITSGVLNDQGYRIQLPNTNNGELSIANGATLSLGSATIATSFPAYTKITLEPESTVIYAGTTQNVAGLRYGNLIISGRGTKTLVNTTSVANELNINSGATLADGGRTFTGPGSTKGIFRMTGTAALVLTATTSPSPMPEFASYNLASTSTVNYAASAAQRIRSIVSKTTAPASTGYGNLTISGGNSNTFKTLNGNITIQGNLDMQAGFLVQNNFDINIQGNWSGTAGNFIASTGASKVTFYGTANSEITRAIIFYNLVINKDAKANTVTIKAPVTLLNSGTATFTMGIVNTSLAFDQVNPLLIFNDKAQAVGASHNSHVNGYMRKIGTENFTYPIGNGIFYRPAGIVPTPDKATYRYDARYINRTYPTVNNNYDSSKATPGLFVSEYEYWHIQLLPGADSSPRIWLSWEMPISGGGSLSGGGDVYYLGDNSTKLTVATWQGTNANGSWSDNGRDTKQTQVLNPRIEKGGINSGASTNTNKTYWALASTDFALPIELVYFKATLVEKAVELDWATAKEINNDYFTIEKSKDGKNFTELTTVNGQGNSMQITKYTSLDYMPYNGVTYYRLKQTDMDGTYTYSKVVAVQTSLKESNALQVYQSASKQLQVNYKSIAEENGVLTIHDSRGVQVWAKGINGSAQEVQEQVNLQSAASGIYMVSLQMPSGKVVKKVIIY